MKYQFIHTADWHADSDINKMNKFELSLVQMVDFCKLNKIDAIIIAGDIWEKKQSYSMKSGVPMVVDYLKKLAKLVDFIFITKGNNSHDEPGSISLLHQIEPNIYAYEYPVVLGVFKDKYEDWLSVNNLLRTDDIDSDNQLQYIVSLVPYPTKASFISNDSIDNNNAEFIENFEQIFELIGDVSSKYDCPKLLGFHGNVVGSKLSSGQTLLTQDIMVSPSSLEKAKHHYYAIGHIHLRQVIKWNMVYSGSIYNKSWGETEQKSFELIEIETASEPELTPLINGKQIFLTSARPMITINLHFEDGKFAFDSGEDQEGALIKSAEFRIRIFVKENDRKLITDEVYIKLKSEYGQDAKIEITIIPNNRESRSEEIMNCQSLLDEVKEYANVIEFEINKNIEQKVNQLQEIN